MVTCREPKVRSSFTFLTLEEGDDKRRDQLFPGSLLCLCICHLSYTYTFKLFWAGHVFFPCYNQVLAQYYIYDYAGAADNK